MKTSDSLVKIAPALVAALSKIEGVAKAKANPGFKGSKYADLESVIGASRDILSENGLTLIQLPGGLSEGVLSLETIIMHTSGEYISGEFGIALGKMDPQGVGSAITYARRYAQMAALNMAAVDDDAEAAMGRNHAQATPSVAVTTAMTAFTVANTQQELTAWLDKNEPNFGQMFSKSELAQVEKAYDARFKALAPDASFRDRSANGMANGKAHMAATQ